MRHGAVREDMFAARQLGKHRLQLGLTRQVTDINVMHKMQIVRWLKSLFNHKAAHRRSIALEQILLNHARFILRYVKMGGYKFGDSHGNAHKQI